MSLASENSIGQHPQHPEALGKNPPTTSAFASSVAPATNMPNKTTENHQQQQKNSSEVLTTSSTPSSASHSSSPTTVTADIERTDNSRKRYIAKILRAAVAQIIPRLSDNCGETLIWRKAAPVVMSLKPTVDTVIDKLDTRFEDIIGRSHVLLDSTQAEVVRRVGHLRIVAWASAVQTRLTGHLGLAVGLHMPGVQGVRQLVSAKWSVTTAWLDERFDVYLEISEAYVDKWVDSAVVDSVGDSGDRSTSEQKVGDREKLTRQQRVLAIPVKLRGHMVQYVLTTAERFKTGTHQLIVPFQDRAYSILVSPKLERPNIMPTRPHQWLRVSFVILRSKFESVISSKALRISGFATHILHDSRTVALRSSAEGLMSSVTGTARQYYNAWALPTTRDMQVAGLKFKKRIVEVYDSIPQAHQQKIVRMYGTVVRGVQLLLGDKVSKAASHFIAQSILGELLMTADPQQQPQVTLPGSEFPCDVGTVLSASALSPSASTTPTATDPMSHDSTRASTPPSRSSPNHEARPAIVTTSHAESTSAATVRSRNAKTSAATESSPSKAKRQNQKKSGGAAVLPAESQRTSSSPTGASDSAPSFPPAAKA